MISGFGVQVLELQECGVQLEQCQLVRYSQHTGTLGKPFDDPKVGADCNVCQKDHQVWLAALSIFYTIHGIQREEKLCGDYLLPFHVRVQ